YFLAYRKPTAATAPAATDPTASAPDPVQAAEDALAKDDVAGALKALESAVAAPDHSPDVDAAYALACRRAGKAADAKKAIERARAARPDDATLVVLAADIALDADDQDGAAKLLALVPAGTKQDDGYFRAQSRLADAKKDEPTALVALAKIQKR